MAPSSLSRGCFPLSSSLAACSFYEAPLSLHVAIKASRVESNDSLWLPAVPVGSFITLVPDVRPGDSLEQNVLSVKVLEGGVRTRRL